MTQKKTQTVAEVAAEWGVSRATVHYALRISGAIELCEKVTPRLLMIPARAKRKAEMWRREHGRK